ncbi:MAG TPA: YetF domain-containing protein [Deinococcales bacterium]|nr:YetF domain-containing protein [Deinococcales bacterium]
MQVLLLALGDIFTPAGGWSLHFVLRVVLSTLLVYLWVVLIARRFGPRTFASFTSFDFLINIAAGSLAATAIARQNLVGGFIAILVLAVVQGIVSGMGARSTRFHNLVDNPAVVLVRDGRVDEAAMRAGRMSRQSLDQKLRDKGVQDIARVRLAVLESGGKVSVIRGEGDERPATFPRRNWPEG